MKLVVLFVDPWKDIEFSEPFNIPENFFAAKTEIAQPKGYPDEPLCMFANDKIKNVSFLPAKPFKEKMKIVALII